MQEVLSRSNLLARRLLLLFLAFSLCRLAFGLYNWSDFAQNSFLEILSTFWWGILFDSVPVFYLSLPIILLHFLPNVWWQKQATQQTVFYLFIAISTVACFMNLADVAYFPFNKKRTGAEVIHLAKDWNTAQLMAYFLDFWHLFVVLFATLGIVIWLWPKHLTNQTKSKPVYWLVYIFFWIGFTVTGMRGGWGLIPLRTFDAGRFVPPSLVPLTINTPFQFICTAEGNNAPSFDFMPDTEASKIVPTFKNYSQLPFQKKNVVIVIVESLGKEYMGFYNEGKGYTPFLDSLCSQSLTFEYSYANGTTSMDAPPALLAGIPHLMDDSYIMSQFNTNTPSSIGSLLKTEGYNTSFYHGGKNGTMGFDNFISLCQMGDYYGLNEYPNEGDFDGKWGIFDEPYLQYYAQELQSKPQPFASVVFTLSSHHPYTVPPPYLDKLPKGTLPIHKSIAYTDLSLRKFFQAASQMTWFKNTLFIITADHTSDAENYLYMSTLGRHSIPFIFYSPSDNTLKGVSKKMMQQSILLPSLMDYLHYPHPFFSLGTSAFQDSTQSSALFYYGGHYFLAQKEWLVLMSPSKEFKLYNHQQDPFLQKDLSNQEPKHFAELKITLQAQLQVYIQRLEKNTF
jgi:phosphoglycerol transferase MdoB-like AlkP superfamily enzyme